MNRRTFLTSCAGVVLSITTAKGALAMGLLSEKKEFPYTLSEKQWREKLTQEQYKILRDHGTERANSSPLNGEKRNGSYHCVGCEQKIFLSEHKFDSGTGWPSFWQPASEEAVGTSKDYKLIVPRTEVHCANCGGHLGHVFNDGPPPTGLRFCLNGTVLAFKPLNG